jgi:hypothetical protein
MLWAHASQAAEYRDKHGNPGDITLMTPVVRAEGDGIDYSVPYMTTDSEGTKSGEYLIVSQMLPGRDVVTPSDDFVLNVFVTDDVSQTGAQLVFRNNPNVSPLAPVLVLYDCSGGPCVEQKRYDDEQAGAWVIRDPADIAAFPIELLDARVILNLLDPVQLAALPSAATGTGNWAEIMTNHRSNFEEAKFRGDVETLGDTQSDLFTSRLMQELDEKHDGSANDWLVRHYPTIVHGALTFMTGHRDLIEDMTTVLFNKHYDDWPLNYTFPFGRMPIWQVDHDQDADSVNFEHLPPFWDRVATGLTPLDNPGCFHDLPPDVYTPTLDNGSMNLGQYECAQAITANGFVDRPCTIEADYSVENVPDTGPGTTLLSDMEGAYHNPVHGFIGGAFGPPDTAAGTAVFWVFHTQVSTNMYANWKHAQKRDMGVPERICNAQGYEAENMFHSTGGSTPGGWNIWSNGYISTAHTFTPGPAKLTVAAKGQQAFGVWPHMVVSVGGETIGDVSVTSATFANYTFQFNAPAGSQEIRVTFDNDVFAPPADRNLLVDKVQVDCVAPGSGACASLCANPTPITWSGSYQGSNLGTGAICLETSQPVVGGNCGNFASGRQLLLNGTQMPCSGSNWSSVPAPLNGGYCVQTTAGDYPWAFVTLW